ncbi:MAG TPA: NADH-quinone oxidoreductase subunit J [Chromatiales bacterium]|nr:NADH-quinone oxidoreductase subunit J [Chromatiales bacterium]
MTFEKFLFYVFAAILVFASVMVVSRRNAVHSALFLVLAFFTSAMIWMLMEAEFLAITLVLVYVGAVMVLFLFVVMMLDIDTDAMRAGFARYLPVGLLVAIIMVMEIALVVGPSHFGLEQWKPPVPHAADYSNTQELGSVLYTVYMYPFEIAAVILLVAIIAAIRLTLRRRPGTRYQNPTEQIAVRRNDRVRIVDVPSEKKMEIK